MCAGAPRVAIPITATLPIHGTVVEGRLTLGDCALTSGSDGYRRNVRDHPGRERAHDRRQDGGPGFFLSYARVACDVRARVATAPVAVPTAAVVVRRSLSQKAEAQASDPLAARLGHGLRHPYRRAWGRTGITCEASILARAHSPRRARLPIVLRRGAHRGPH